VLDNDLLGVLEPLEPKVPFFRARDKVDYAINTEAIAFTRRWPRENTELTTASYPDMGHSLELDELADVAKVLTRKFLAEQQ
jgi:phospholipase/carboxylesterase